MSSHIFPIYLQNGTLVRSFLAKKIPNLLKCKDESKIGEKIAPKA